MPAATISIRAPTSCAASLSARSDWYGSIPKDVSPGALAIPRCRAMRPSAAWCASAPPRSSSSARCPILWRLISRPYPQPTSVSPKLRLSHIALPVMIGDLVKRALLPFLSLRKPENPALQIKRGALPAQGFLTANFDQSVHALHSCHVKPFPANQRNRIRPFVSCFLCILRHGMGQQRFPCSAAVRAPTSSPHHQYVIEAPDGFRDRAVLTLVAQWRAAICEEK